MLNNFIMFYELDFVCTLHSVLVSFYLHPVRCCGPFYIEFIELNTMDMHCKELNKERCYEKSKVVSLPCCPLCMHAYDPLLGTPNIPQISEENSKNEFKIKRFYKGKPEN